MNMKKQEIMGIAAWLILMLFILALVSLSTGCNSGWSVGSLAITPSDSIHIDYLIITDQDSSQHWYLSNTVNDGIIVGSNYCHKHEIWEDVRKKSE
tara:strand:+ start:952 stop:1239 length:288 start_codon:yes stop_codon:yes gene_type:complete